MPISSNLPTTQVADLIELTKSSGDVAGPSTARNGEQNAANYRETLAHYVRQRREAKRAKQDAEAPQSAPAEPTRSTPTASSSNDAGAPRFRTETNPRPESAEQPDVTGKDASPPTSTPPGESTNSVLRPAGEAGESSEPGVDRSQDDRPSGDTPPVESVEDTDAVPAPLPPASLLSRLLPPTADNEENAPGTQDSPAENPQPEPPASLVHRLAERPDEHPPENGPAVGQSSPTNTDDAVEPVQAGIEDLHIVTQAPADEPLPVEVDGPLDETELMDDSDVAPTEPAGGEDTSTDGDAVIAQVNVPVAGSDRLTVLDDSAADDVPVGSVTDTPQSQHSVDSPTVQREIDPQVKAPEPESEARTSLAANETGTSIHSPETLSRDEDDSESGRSERQPEASSSDGSEETSHVRRPSAVTGSAESHANTPETDSNRPHRLDGPPEPATQEGRHESGRRESHDGPNVGDAQTGKPGTTAASSTSHSAPAPLSADEPRAQGETASRSRAESSNSVNATSQTSGSATPVVSDPVVPAPPTTMENASTAHELRIDEVGSGRAAAVTNAPVSETGTSTRAADARSVPVQPRELVDRAATGLHRALREGRALTLRLHPPELGELRIQVHWRNGTVEARLEVQSSLAHRTFTETLPQLHEALQRAGAPVDRIAVDYSSEGNDGSGTSFSGGDDTPAHQHRHEDGHRPEHDDETSPAVENQHSATADTAVARTTRMDELDIQV